MMPDFPEGVTDDLDLMLRLHEGIWAGDLNRVVAALERGAAPDVMNARRNPPLVVAAMQGHTAIAETLLDRGADPSLRGSDGSALQWAILRGNVDMALRLLGAGASVSWGDLQNACERRVPAVAEAILDRGVDVNGSTGDGGTALMSAAFVGDTATAVLLLNRRAEVNARTVTGWAALLSAAARGHAAVVRLLLDAGADIAAQDKGGDTALRLATAAEHSEVVQVLRDAGAGA